MLNRRKQRQRNDHNVRGPRPARRPGRGPRPPGHHRALRRSRRSPSPTPSPGATCCGKAKTGSGKTLAFGLPLLGRIGKAEPRRPKALILVPTRELATQVTDVLAPARRGARPQGAGRLRRRRHGTRRSRRCSKGVDVIVATPGPPHRPAASARSCRSPRSRCWSLDEADRMADMGFMPQVAEDPATASTAPHQTMLFSATLDGAVNRLVDRYLNDPVSHETGEDEPTVDEMDHRLPRHPPDGQGEGRGGDRQRQQPHPDVHAHQARRRPARRAARPRGRARPPPSTATCARAAREKALADFIGGQAPGARRHRRRRPRHPRRRRRRRDPLRPARGPQGLPAPLGPHRPRPARAAWPSRSCCGTRRTRSG